jgi:hypothetical protein
LVPQDIKTDRTICVDVGVIDLGREADFGRFEGIIDWEGDGEEEDTSGIRRLPLVITRIRTQITRVGTTSSYRPHDGGLPLEHVVAGRSCTAGGGWVTPEVNQFLAAGSVTQSQDSLYSRVNRALPC